MLFSVAEHPPLRFFVLQTAAVSLPLMWTGQNHFLWEFQVLKDVKTHQPQRCPHWCGPVHVFLFPERMWSSGGPLRTQVCCLKCSFPSYWHSIVLPLPWTCLSIPQIRLKAVQDSETSLNWNMHGAALYMFWSAIVTIQVFLGSLTVNFFHALWWNQKYLTTITILTIVKKRAAFGWVNSWFKEYERFI